MGGGGGWKLIDVAAGSGAETGTAQRPVARARHWAILLKASLAVASGPLISFTLTRGHRSAFPQLHRLPAQLSA